jgi:hypothetical protein
MIDKTVSAITDSGTSGLYLPPKIYDLVKNYLSDCCGLTYNRLYSEFTLPYSQVINLPTIDLLYGGYWM